MEIKKLRSLARWGKEIITGLIIVVVGAYVIGEGRFARRAATDNILPLQTREMPQNEINSRPGVPPAAENEKAKSVDSALPKIQQPTQRPTRSTEESRKPAPPDVSPAEIPRRKEPAELKKPDLNDRQDHSSDLIPPPSASLPSLKGTPPYIANIYRSLRSIKKKVDEGNPHGIADPVDVSAFNQYLSVLKNKSEIEELKNMRIIVPENYTQMRDLKAALSGLLVALEVNYDRLSILNTDRGHVSKPTSA
ncbi:MAG: hypothetical protein WD688_00205 [Candidatus Binatia bacterium]